MRVLSFSDALPSLFILLVIILSGIINQHVIVPSVKSIDLALVVPVCLKEFGDSQCMFVH